MSSSEDRRVRRTKGMINDAFLKLSKEKPPGSITVTEICKTADINRSTFYAHYQDVPALIDEYEEESARRLVGLYKEYRTVRDTDKVTMINNFLDNMFKNKDAFALLLRSGTHSKGIDVLCQAMERPCIENWLMESRLSEEQARWLYIFLFSGVMGLFEYWCDSGAAELDVSMKKIVSDAITGALYNYIEHS